jgi:hypothetical protein
MGIIAASLPVSQTKHHFLNFLGASLLALLARFHSVVLRIFLPAFSDQLGSVPACTEKFSSAVHRISFMVALFDLRILVS